jgi:hypothetical protein
MSRFELEKISIPKTYNEDGKYHSFSDKPADEDLLGVYWCKHGIFHRENNKPSHIFFEGVLWWATEDKLVKVEQTDSLFPSNETTWEDGIKI